MADKEANLLSSGLVSELRRLIRWTQNFRVTGAKFRNTPEGATIDVGSPPVVRPQIAQNETILAQLDTPTKWSTGTDALTYWTWNQVTLRADGIVDTITGGLNSTNSGYAWSRDPVYKIAPGGEVVTLRRAAIDNGTTKEQGWWIVTSRAAAVFPVRLIDDGSSGGVPPWRYDVEALGGTTLATAVFPESIAHRTGAGGSFAATRGLAYYSAPNTLVVAVAFESVP